MRTCLCALLLVSLAAASWPQPRDQIVLSNRFVQRTLVLRDDTWRTVSFDRADGTDALRTQSDEFLIRLMDGTALTIADFRARRSPVMTRTGAGSTLAITYVPRGPLPAGAPESITVTYSLRDEPYLRKTITLAMPENGAVDRLEVERFATGEVWEGGGYGEPRFTTNGWFAGLEYPAGYNEGGPQALALAHFPGLAKHDPHSGRWTITSKTAVIGIGAKDDPPRLAFSDYLDTIRRPSRSFLQYNSWYDFRSGELTPENLTATFDSFRKNLLEPYGLKMDAFVPDDGWQDPNSIWVPRKDLYPDGFAPLRDALEARGTRLGVWMPLNGTNLNIGWGVREGYEKSNVGDFYCLVGPRYNMAIREATRRIITQGNLAYYKHDFNTLHCTAGGHGHLPDDLHGHEANLDAELELLAYERQVQPDIFLNITSSVWLSPWWLMHADSVWMCAGDYGYDKAFPQLSPREWETSYRDVNLYDVYTRQRRLVPVSAMMTHGIINGKYAKLGGDEETLREWSDYVVMYYGRGVQLKELYITPDLLDRPRWQVLGEATRWAVENADTLNNVILVGGDPRKGEIYGYAHWRGDRGIICLRNPGLASAEASIPFDKSVRYRGRDGRAFRARVVYPFVEELPTPFVSGSPATFRVPGASVMACELRPGNAPSGEPIAPARIEGATAALAARKGRSTQLTAHVPVPDEDMARCDLILCVRGAAAAIEDITLNGKPAPVRHVDGPGWGLDVVDLRPLRGRDADLAAALPAGGSQPFSNIGEGISAWLLADRPVAAQPIAREHLPFPIAQGFRRQTVELLADTALGTPPERRHLDAADLATIRAAKLRIRVFDVNGEPEYRDKFIFLNGKQLARVPVNEGELSAWQESIVDLAPEQLPLLKMENTLELTNAGGDCYKFTGLTLAVQLADGTWVESTTDSTVHSSVSGWLYTEGEVFEGERSGEVGLRFR